MHDFAIRLSDMETVKKFVSEMSHIDCDMDLIARNRRYVVDAKSIMGILSLDITQELTLRVYTEESAAIERVSSVLSGF